MAQFAGRDDAVITETQRSNDTRLEIAAQFDTDRATLWRAFTDAERLVAWWPEEATVDAVVGGVFEARWPSMDWTLRGRFTAAEPLSRLAFTWSWDHEPAVPERIVEISLAGDDPVDLVLSHGTYGTGDEEERAGHLDGWKHFLSLLSEAI